MMRIRPAFGLCLGLLGVAWFGTACMPLPAAAPPRNTFDEREFAADPKKSASLEHIVMVHLEPTGTHEGDTGSAEGVDEIPYEITEPTQVSVGVLLSENHGHWIELLDSKGNSLLLARGTHASSAVTLEPGRYIARLHHGQPGVDTEYIRTMLLRTTHYAIDAADSATAQNAKPNAFQSASADSDYDMCEQSNVRTTNDDRRRGVVVWFVEDVSCLTFDGADFSAHIRDGSSRYAGSYLQFIVSRNAVFRNCNFDGAMIYGQLTDSQFINCSMTNVIWRFTLSGNSTMTGCDFTDVWPSCGMTMKGVTFDGCKFAQTDFTACAPYSRPSDPGLSLPYSGGPAADFSGSTFQNCDFTGANLSGTNFSNASLGNSELSQANLSGANFKNADLGSVTLANVDISGANFDGAILDDATLTGVDFTDFDLTGVRCRNNSTLVGLTFTGATLDRADFSGSDLNHANLERASAIAANFENAVLDQVVAYDAAMIYANLAGASLSGAQLGGASDSGVVPAKLSFAYMPNVKITNGADCRNVDFSHVHMYGDQASVQGADLTGASFAGAIVSGMDFGDATLESCSFVDAQAVGTRFIGARVTNAKFESAYLMGADFTGAIATDAVFVDAAVSTAPCNGASTCSACDDCEFSDLDPANLCCYSFSEVDGTVYTVTFGATILPNDPSIYCPDGNLGPCTGTKLVPHDHGPYPPVPACVPSPLNWCPAPAQ